MEGSRSVLGVVQLTPYDFLVAFVMSVLSRAVKAHRNWPLSVGRFSITRSNCAKKGEKKTKGEKGAAGL
jgi:hypothetical protein